MFAVESSREDLPPVLRSPLPPLLLAPLGTPVDGPPTVRERDSTLEGGVGVEPFCWGFGPRFLGSLYVHESCLLVHAAHG